MQGQEHQTPGMMPQQSTSQQSTPRPRSNLKKLALFLGLPLAGLLFLIIVGSLAGDDKNTSGAPNDAKAGQGAAKTSAAPLPAAYMGKWQGQDGTSLSIRGDGKGDFDGGNVKVSGGGVTLDEGAKTLKISSFFGIGKQWKVDAAPHQADGRTEMKLNGLVYRKSGGFTPGAASPAEFAADKVPAPGELQRLVKETTLDFNDGLQKKNFTAFQAGISKTWQEQITAEELLKAFQPFIDEKLDLAAATKNLKANFTPAPLIDEQGVLTLKGFYATRPQRLYFRMRFVPEDDAWKLLGLSFNIGKPVA